MEGRAAAEGQGAAPMAEACGGERAPDGHNPEVVTPFSGHYLSNGAHRHFASPSIFPFPTIGFISLNGVMNDYGRTATPVPKYSE
jgi:hypothetical protein